MKFCLVTAPTTNGIKEGLPEITGQDAPLGVLSVAGALAQISVSSHILDLDWWYADRLKSKSVTQLDIAVEAARDIAAIEADCFGFSSICSSYPLTLRIAMLLKKQRPNISIVLGGPQATAVADETVAEFPFVDVVVRGEAEYIMPSLVQALSDSRELLSVPGISFRSNDRVIRNPDARVIEDLDALPLPPFHLYPHLKDCRSLPLEIGRGCPFSCTFCSTSIFFRRKYRLKSPQIVVQQMIKIHQELGFSAFHLVHDNYTIDRERVVDFCTQLRESGAKFKWTCSARTDCVDDELLRLMKGSGCAGIFFGVEVGSDRMQRSIGKRLNLNRTAAVIQHANRHKLESAAAFMLGFPDETLDDTKATLDFFLDLLRYDYIAPQISLLSPLAGTPLQREHKDELVLDGIVSDLAFEGIQQEGWEHQMIAAHPTVFSSFYGIPTRWLDRNYVDGLRNFLLHSEAHFRWLLVAAHQAVGNIFDLFNMWQRWRSQFTPDGQNVNLIDYYRGQAFPCDFIEFVRTELSRRCIGEAKVLRSIAHYYLAVEKSPSVQREKRTRYRTLTNTEACLVCRPEICVTDVDFDYSKLIRRLRRHERFDRMPRCKTTLVTRCRKGRVEILQLSPIAAELLRACDGTKSVHNLACRFARNHKTLNGIPGEKACVAVLELLCSQGFLMVDSSSSEKTRN